MESHDPTPMTPSEAENANPIGSAVPAGSPGSVRSGAVRLWALGAGAAAALLSWLLIEATLDSFKPKGTATQFMTNTYMIPVSAGTGYGGNPECGTSPGTDGRRRGAGVRPGRWPGAPVGPSRRGGGVSGAGAGCGRGSRQRPGLRCHSRLVSTIEIPEACPSRWPRRCSCTAFPGRPSAQLAAWLSASDWASRARIARGLSGRSSGCRRRCVLVRDHWR